MTLRSTARVFGALLYSALGTTGLAHRIDSPPSWTVESGAPPFVVHGREALGLDAPPTDLRAMPDGRLLLIAGQQLALGDGVRWNVFRQAPADSLRAGTGVAVDRDGRIYVGISGACARVDFGDNGEWHLKTVARWSEPGQPAITLPEAMVTETGGEWFWHSRTGPVVQWRPGETPRRVGWTNTFEQLFEADGRFYLSDRPNGTVSSIGGADMVPFATLGTRSAITSATRFGPGTTLLGTYGAGLKIFDGTGLRPLPGTDVLADGSRINDVCVAAEGWYAAAVDNFGVVVFDRDGRIRQTLDKTLDQRLSRVKRLLPSGAGLWGLLDDGLVQIESPSQISNFEPLIGLGTTTVHPFRIGGRLWMLADGTVYRGIYTPSGRFVQLAADSPAQVFVSALGEIDGVPIAGTESGAFRHTDTGWISFAPNTTNLRILDVTAGDGSHLYCAENEVGWLHHQNGSFEIIGRKEVPGLGRTFNTAVKDQQGRIWLELGTGVIGIVSIVAGQPEVRLLTARDGVPESWSQVFEVNGVVRFDFADAIYRYNDATGRVEPDPEFLRQFPGIHVPFGRPGVDGHGRLWIAADGVVQVFRPDGTAWNRLPLDLAAGFLPYFFTFESDGVVWMHAQHRLARFDPDMPSPARPTIRALITYISLSNGGRTTIGPPAELPPVAYSDNSLVAHFVANANPLTTPISFEVRLEGGADDWVSTGSSGSAVFNRLKEGRYVLHVRPRSGDSVGQEASLAFTILPPWYRTTFAYAIYTASVVAGIALIIWLSAFFERREKQRLERLVAQRTGELNQSNRQLAHQLDEIRRLSQAIEQSPVAVFVTDLNGIIAFANARASQQSGYGRDELIGQNIRKLRSDLVAADRITEIDTIVARGQSWHGELMNRHRDGHMVHVRLTGSPIRGADGAVQHYLLLEEDITESVNEQERRQRLEAKLVQAQKLESIGALAGGIAHDFNNILTGILGFCELANQSAEAHEDVRPDLREIKGASMRAKELISQILAFSRQGHTKLLPLDLSRPVAEAMKLVRVSAPATVEIVSRLESGFVLADPTQIHQAVINLCTNAVHAIGAKPGRIEVVVRHATVDTDLARQVPDLDEKEYICLSVADNGHGIDASTLSRIFDPFFTTKQRGEGTGLGLAIVQGIVTGHHGALRVLSTVNVGTTFELYFPTSHDAALVRQWTAEPPRGDGQGILVLDDEPAVTSFASARLRQFGYHPVVFNDPRAALQEFTQAPGRFDAIVSDLTMPHLTGLEVLLKMRAIRPDFPAVIITAQGRAAANQSIGALPLCWIVAKPFEGEELIRALGQVLHPTTGERS